MVSGAISVITDQRLSLLTVGTLINPTTLGQIAAAGAVALALCVGLHRGRNPFLIPGILLLAAILAHFAFALTDTSLSEALALGWTFKAPNAVGLAPTWDFGDVQHFPWHIPLGLSGDIFAVMLVTAITMLLNATGIELATRREADLGRELKTLGVANTVAALLGGYVSCISLSRTTLVYASGGRSRACGLTVAVASVLMLTVDPSFIAHIPKFVLGGLLLYLGASLMYEWLVDAARRISLLEYASLLAIALLIVQFGFIAGVLIGVVIGCATFAVSASRVNAIKFRFDGSEYRSTLDRGPKELAILAANGREIQGMSLQSYLFFSSANRLYQQVKALFADQSDCSFLVFDFRLVTGMDSMHSFTQIKQVAVEVGARLVLVNLSHELGNAFRTRGFITGDVVVASDLDRALEACEEAVIAAHMATGGEAQTLRDWFAQKHWAVRACRSIGRGLRAARCRQGCDHCRARRAGRLNAFHPRRPGRHHRQYGGWTLDPGGSLGAHTTIGEMGLITSQLRSATIKAEVPSVLYALSAEAYHRIKRENEPLAQALLTYVVSVMAERLSFCQQGDRRAAPVAHRPGASTDRAPLRR